MMREEFIGGYMSRSGIGMDTIEIVRMAVERRARQIWAERETRMPKFVRQSWEQGTYLAQRATLGMALEELPVELWHD